MQKIRFFFSGIRTKIGRVLHRGSRYESSFAGRSRIKINVKGSAMQVKGRAAVVAEHTGIYFVDGMNDWTDAWLHHSIRVIGDLEKPEGQGRLIRNAVIQLLQEEQPQYSDLCFPSQD